jgi:hypothetical protein
MDEFIELIQIGALQVRLFYSDISPYIIWTYVNFLFAFP